MTAGRGRFKRYGGLVRTAVIAVALLVLPTGPIGAQSLPGEPLKRIIDPSGTLIPKAAATTAPDALPGPSDIVPGFESTGEVVAKTLDYAAWELFAERAENFIFNNFDTSEGLEALRVQLVDWRAALLGAQSLNSTRIATLREQITALGPEPAGEAGDAEEIVTRRAELAAQLVRLQAPGITAQEAYKRADGLIREIDRVLRERRAEQLSQHWPVPINPANWPEAWTVLAETVQVLRAETALLWQTEKARLALKDRLPLVIALLLLALAILARGRIWIERGVFRLQNKASVRSRALWAFLISLGQVIVPTLGVVLLVAGFTLTGMLANTGLVFAMGFPAIGLTLFAAIWLGGRVFSRDPNAEVPLNLTPEQKAEGRLLATMMGLVLGLKLFHALAMAQIQASAAAASVLAFPILLLAGLLLIRMGSLMQQHVINETDSDATRSYITRLIAVLARSAKVIGVIGPALAAVGYVSAGTGLLMPAIYSLSMIGLLSILQQLVGEAYAIVTRDDGKDGKEPLVPVLLGFGLALGAIPLFALIWGARTADITELWARFSEGFQLGDTRISPTVFMVFVVVFVFGYSLTRVFQGALRASILPRTGLDKGGQNAIISGVGYAGIFLAGLAAINSAGIDLSGFAIVAGALSVGIGFGLQTIVSNFVSGIILLIERPISEGDWIEVGTVQGIVKSISVRSTRIQTFDRSDVIVPNTDLIAGRVTNWTRYSLTGRLIVPVAVPFTADSRKVEAALLAIAEAQPLVILNPAPHVVLIGFGPDTMNFEIRVVLRDVNMLVLVRSEINHQIARSFVELGIHHSNAQRDYLERIAKTSADETDALRQAQADQDAVAALLAPVEHRNPAVRRPADEEPHRDD